MNKQRIEYLFFTLCVVSIALFPKTTQSVFRNQFLRLFIPFTTLAARRPPSLTVKEPPLKTISSYTPTYPGSTVAKVIYRNSTQWNSYFWINLGAAHNETTTVVQPYSPVLFQNNLIGIIDYVGKRQSRVKLVTNAQSTISVKTLTQGQNCFDLISHIDAVLSYEVTQNSPSLTNQLLDFKQKLVTQSQPRQEVKGELTGNGKPLWHSSSCELIGKGFYNSIDYSPLFGASKSSSTHSMNSLFKKDDILITTGLDGIFPEGLIVAKVTGVETSKGESSAYNIQATPLVSPLDELMFVEVILPLEGHEANSLKLH